MNGSKMKSPPQRDVPKATVHTIAEWEAVHDTFRELYIDQGKSLDDTIAHMKDDLGFAATRRQWERRIKLWGLSKYVRADARQQFVDEALAAGMTEAELLNAQNIPVDESGGDDQAQRRNWRRYVKRQILRRTPKAQDSLAATSNSVSIQAYDLSAPDISMSDLSPSSAWTSPNSQMSSASSWTSPVQAQAPPHEASPPATSREVSAVPEISVSYWNDDGQLMPQSLEQQAPPSALEWFHTGDTDIGPYASDLSYRSDGVPAEVLPNELSRPAPGLLTKDIRLVHVHPGIRDSDISVERVDSSLNTGYEALSYCWGSVDFTKSIIVNGSSYRISQNLCSALKALRYPDRTRVLWVDALCIDQSNNVEKAEQVAKMGAIYSSARRVCIWLGENTNNTVLARDFIRSVADLEEFDRLLKQPSPPPSWEAFSELTRRSYWSRAWVLQEVVLETDATVYWGTHESPWVEFIDALSLFTTSIERLPKSWRASHKYEHHGKYQSQPDISSAQHFVSLLSHVARRRENGKVQDFLQPLGHLVTLTRSLSCTDPRDRIYAMIGLASDAALIPISPNYSASVIQVYKSFLQHYLKQSNSLDILCLPWAAGNDLPSWIGQSTNDTFQVTPMGEYKRVHADSLTWSSSSAPVYSASANRKAEYRFDNIREQSLFVQGFELGRIKAAASVGRAGCVPADWLTLSSWEVRRKPPPPMFWRTLVADRSSGGTQPPPTFYARACQWVFEHTVAKDDLNTEAMISSPHTPSTVVDFLHRVQAVVWKRRLVRTYSGHIGLAPEGTTFKDIIALIFGCSVPLILRASEATNPTYKLIGECYIHGWMNGEALQNRAKTGARTFELI